MDHRYAFVIGTGRCGSTMVHDVVARHHDVAFLSNVQDTLWFLDPNGRSNDLLYRHAPDRLMRLVRSPGSPSEAYGMLDRRVSPILSRSFRDLTAEDATPWLVGRLRRCFGSCAAAQGRSLLLHKFTGWPRAGFLGQAFPETRFVHIVRDGRAVANSWLQVPWAPYGGPAAWQWGPLPPEYEQEWARSGRSFVVLAGIGWKVLMDSYDDARSKAPPASWLEMRYEDVVADPRGSFASILSFLGLRWDRRFETWFARYDFRGGRLDAYRSELRPADRALLDESLGPHLERYGYS
jgi:Sulfotransferase family